MGVDADPRGEAPPEKLQSEQGQAAAPAMDAELGLADLPLVVSLFCGAGGLDWGFQQEGFRIPLSIDISAAAVLTHKRNFKDGESHTADLVELGPDGVAELVNNCVPRGSRIGVIGGPPCQGFSRANTGSQEDDPRNTLPALYVDIVRRLQQDFAVEFVVFENVLGIRDKKHAATYADLLEGLEGLGMDITEKELCALDFGVPQNRRRVVLSALRRGQGYSEVRPLERPGLRTVEEAIGGLDHPAFFSARLKPVDIPVHPNHWTMRPKSRRFSNPEAFRNDGRSFKRLVWSEASPTIAFGHREIHVHPSGTRRLSIYEAMLLQGFPETFVLEGNLSEQVEQVSNAVPPPLGQCIAAAVKRALTPNQGNHERSNSDCE